MKVRMLVRLGFFVSAAVLLGGCFWLTTARIGTMIRPVVAGAVRAGSATEVSLIARAGTARLSARTAAGARLANVTEYDNSTGIVIQSTTSGVVRVSAKGGQYIGSAQRSGNEVRIFDRNGRWRGTAHYTDRDEEQAAYVYIASNGELKLGWDELRNQEIFHQDRFRRVVARSWTRTPNEPAQLKQGQNEWIQEQLEDHALSTLREEFISGGTADDGCSRCAANIQATIFNRCARDVMVLVGRPSFETGTGESRWIYVPSRSTTSLTSGIELLATRCTR